MSVVYRPARFDDLAATEGLVVSSINDLTERHGFGPMAAASPPRFQAFSLSDDARGLWIAEADEEPVGFAWSWTCDDFWFLAQLFVKPGVQGAGTGRALLHRALEHADDAGAARRALITFAFNIVSQSLYIQHGFTPRFPIYSMACRRDDLASASGMALAADLLSGAESQFRQLSDVDRQALGFSREKHHRFLAADPGARLFGFHENGRLAGYAYVSASGHIGPLAVVSPDLLESAFETALSLSADAGAENVSCFLPGANVGLLRRAMRRGLRIRFPMLMMSTGDPGCWPCYLPRNPGFM